MSIGTVSKLIGFLVGHGWIRHEIEQFVSKEFENVGIKTSMFSSAHTAFISVLSKSIRATLGDTEIIKIEWSDFCEPEIIAQCVIDAVDAFMLVEAVKNGNPVDDGANATHYVHDAMNNNPTPTQSFIAFDDITDELKIILYRTALEDFMADFKEDDVVAILTALENSPPDDFAGTAGRGDENNPNSDLFTVCENFHYTTCEDLLDEIHSSARAYYRFMCNMSQYVPACVKKDSQS